MATIVVNTNDGDTPDVPIVDEVPIVEPEPEPIAPVIPIVPPSDATAEAFEVLADAVGDIEEVLAAVVDIIDDIVDVLNASQERESEEHHEELPTVEPAKVKRAKKELADVEPAPRHKVRAIMLGRSGGMR